MGRQAVDRESAICRKWVGKRQKMGQKVVENGSESGRKWVSKQKKGLSIAPKRSPYR